MMSEQEQDLGWLGNASRRFATRMAKKARESVEW